MTEFEKWLSGVEWIVNGQRLPIPLESGRLLKRAYDAGRDAAIPDGYCIVPRQPTKAMLKAGDTAFKNGYVREVWEAMIKRGIGVIK